MLQLIAQARTFEARCTERAVDFQKFEAGQSPQALFITCSDSRVVPSLITGAEPGELFELRTAGNIVPVYSREHPAGETATIEYAVRVLGVRHIVVCGHSHCGAVGALVRNDDLGAAPAVRAWLDSAAPRQPQPPNEVPGPIPSDVAEAAQRHALAQLDRLRAYPCVREGTEGERLTLHAWFYEVSTGAVRSHQPGSGAFLPL